MPDTILKIALPKTKGTHRVGTYLSEIFYKNGIRQEASQNRQDDCWFKYSENPKLNGFQGFHASSSDCVDYLSDGIIDAAVIGLNRLVDKVLLSESSAHNISYVPLGVEQTRCKVVFATNENYRPQQDLDVVLTSHAGIAKRYFQKAAMRVGRVITFDGSLEIAARELYQSSPIVDITQTGESLEANGLIPQDTLLVSEAVIAYRNDGVLNSMRYNSFQAFLTRLGVKEKSHKRLSQLHLFNA